jgi:hypothetical protein
MVIGGQHQHHPVGIEALDQDGGGGGGRRGVARLGFDQHVIDAWTSWACSRTISTMAAPVTTTMAPPLGQVAHPQQGLLEAGMDAQQFQELLGTIRARGRPQARAGPAAQDDREDGGHEIVPEVASWSIVMAVPSTPGRRNRTRGAALGP